MKSLRPVSATEERLTRKNGTLELPSFMSPLQARDMLQQRLDQTAKKLRRYTCVNAVIILTPTKVNEKKMSVHPGDIQYDKNHCQNDRRNGSKFCQKCSDEHHAN